MADGVELATAWVRLVPSVEGITDQVVKQVGGADMEKAGKASGRKWSAGAKAAMTVGAAAVSAAVVKIFTTGVEELKYGEQISAQTDILVKNTGFTMATSQIEDYTLALSQLSGISEEDLQAAGNSILKFGNLSEDAYKQAVASVNDIAATGKDATATAEGLGKALADPATAAGKLRRMGISLTEQQQEQIKAMTKAGDTAGAQKVILDALETTYGGMAEATGGTLEGNLNKLNNSWENLAGAAVESLMPAIQGVVGMLQGFIGWISENEGMVQILVGGLGILAAAWVAVTVAMWAASMTPITLIIGLIVVAIGLLVAAIIWLVANWDQVVVWITDIWGGFMSWITGVIDGFVGWWNGVWSGVGAWIKRTWDGFVGWIENLWAGFIAWLILAGVRISSWWNGLWSGIGKWISDVWSGIVTGVRSYFERVWSGLKIIGSGIASWWNGLWKGIGDFFGGIWDGILDAVDGFGRFFRDVFGGIKSFVRTAFSGVLGVVKGPINGLIGLVNSAIRALNGLSVTIPDWVPLVGGQTWGLSIPTIPMLANGGTITRGGAVIVGERGPEVLRLPAGATVDPDISSVNSGGDTYEFHGQFAMTPEEIGLLLDRRKRAALYQSGALRKTG